MNLEYQDYRGHAIRLTENRWKHIQEHPEMAAQDWRIGETLASPACVVRSRFDEHVHLYYKVCELPRLGEKLLCVVVKFTGIDAFIITAYITDKIKKGEILWPIEA